MMNILSAITSGLERLIRDEMKKEETENSFSNWKARNSARQRK